MDSTISIPVADAPMQSEYTDGFVGIRRFRREDAASLYVAARESIDELSMWMTWCHAGYSVTDGVAFVSSCDHAWESSEHYSFVIFDPKSGKFLGSVGLNQFNRTHGFANLGYWVRQSWTGRGVAPAAVRLIARFAFEQLGLHRLEIVIPTGNRPSQRAAEKAGAHREGILRNRLVLHGQLHDAAVYSLVPGAADSSFAQLSIL